MNLNNELQQVARACGLLPTTDSGDNAEGGDGDDDGGDVAEPKSAHFSSMEESTLAFEISKNFAVGDYVKHAKTGECFRIEGIGSSTVKLLRQEHGEEKGFVDVPSLSFVKRANAPCVFRKIKGVQRKAKVGHSNSICSSRPFDVWLKLQM